MDSADLGEHVRRWVAEFQDPDLERAFQLDGMSARASTLQRSMYAAAISVLAVTGPRLIATGFTLAAVGVSSTSFGLAAAGAAFAHRVGRHHELALRFAFVSALAAWGMIMVIAGPLATDAPIGACNLVLCGLVFGEFLFLPNRLAYTTLIGAIGAGLYLVASWTFFPRDHMVDAQSAVVIVVLVAVAYVTAADNERTRRHQYLARRAEQRTIEQLNREIITRQHVEAELAWLADHDALTDLLGRRAFFERAEEVLATARRSDTPVSVLVIDADHFKAINDRFGHHTGDEAIRLIARTCKSSARSIDVIGRLGGEEFAIVMPGVDLAMALQIGDNLCDRIRTGNIEHPYGVLDLTVSIGAAQCRIWSESLADCLGRGDAAMYDAKRLGRDRTAVA